jgi:hypothetical protein
VDDEEGGHGPKFVSIMEKINERANTNVTVYHHFHNQIEYNQNLSKLRRIQKLKQETNSE